MAVGRTLCLLLLSAALAAPALAQVPTRANEPEPSSAHWKDRRGEWEARRQAHDRQRAADIALILRLKPDQQAAFQAMEASMRPPRDEEHGPAREGGDGAPLTATQAFDRMQAKLSEHEARLRAHLDAARRFYASLSPEQQGLFDALMRLRDGGGEGERGGGRGGPPAMAMGEGAAMEKGLAPPPGL